jgi:hypothetical protein
MKRIIFLAVMVMMVVGCNSETGDFHWWGWFASSCECNFEGRQEWYKCPDSGSSCIIRGAGDPWESDFMKAVMPHAIDDIAARSGWDYHSFLINSPKPYPRVRCGWKCTPIIYVVEHDKFQWKCKFIGEKIDSQCGTAPAMKTKLKELTNEKEN